MESIYIENYITMSPKQKEAFLIFIHNFKDLRVKKQKLLFCEESLLLEFFERSSIDKAYERLKIFFKNFTKIKVDIITQIIPGSDYSIFRFKNDRQLRIKKRIEE